MTHRRRLIALVFSVMSVLGAWTPGTALPVAQSPAPTDAQPAGSRSMVVLPTGESVVMAGPGSTRSAAVVASAHTGTPGAETATLRLTAGAADYVFPRSARALLGRVLDPRLFDTSRLATAGGRLPVTITATGDTVPTDVPGVEITSRRGRTALGVITASSARSLGAALRISDPARLFAGIAAVRPTPVETPAARWPMHTLTVRIVGRDGRPTQAMATTYDTRDATKPIDTYFIDGVHKMSLPAGRRQLLVTATAADWTEVYIVPSPEFAFYRNKALTIDLRAATTQFRTSVNTPLVRPRAATQYARRIRVGRNVNGIQFTADFPDSSPVYIAPTRGEVTGEQALNRFLYGSGPRTSEPLVRVMAVDRVVGSIPRGIIKRTNDIGSMVTYRTRVAGRFDAAHLYHGRGVITPLGEFVTAEWVGTRRMTEYVTAGPELLHFGVLFQSISTTPRFAQKGYFVQNPHAAPPAGAVRIDTWAAAPLHQTFPDPPAQLSDPACPACLGGGELLIHASPLSDNTHLGEPDYVEPTVFGLATIRADGRVIGQGRGMLSAVVPVRPGTRRLSTEQVATRTGAPFTHTTRTLTRMSLPLSASFPAPPAWRCTADPCRVLPFLSLDYAVAGAVDNTLPPGSHRLRLTVRQVGRGLARGVTSLAAWSSTDGHAWTRLPVSGDGPRRTVVLLAPPAGLGRSTLALKVHVQDASGGRLEERIDGAFALAGSPAPAR